MAARKEILSDLSSKIGDGNIREAYRTFEELPVVDQIAVSIAPGVGDVLAAYEVGEFGRRAKTNIEDKDYLGATGNRGLQILSGISLYPLFRFLRGAKAVAKSGAKAVDAPKTLKPPVEEPLQLAPPKDVLPEVEPFTPKPIAELGYQTGPDQPILQSKVRKLLNEHKVGTTSLNKDLQTATPEKWVEELQKNITIDVHGELRLLNVLDEAGDIHPNLTKTAGPGKEISRQGLDNYIARQQVDALNIRRVPEPYQPGNLADPGMTYNETQNLYFVRGTSLNSGRALGDSHYVGDGGRGGVSIDDPKYSGQNAYVFDGAGFSDGFPIGRLSSQYDDLPAESGTTAEDLTRALREIGIGPNDKIKSVIRTQSDFTKHGPNKVRELKERALTSAQTNFDAIAKIPRVYQEANISIKDAISAGPNAKIVGSQRSELISNLKPEFDAALRANDEQAMRKILGDDLYKTFTDTEFGTRVPGKFFAPRDDFKNSGYSGSVSFNQVVSDIFKGDPTLSPQTLINRIFGNKSLIKPSEDLKDVVADLGGKQEVAPVIEEIFKRTENVKKIKEKIFNQDPSGYLDLKQQKEIQKKLSRYTKLQDRINTATARSFNETGSTQVPGSSADDLVELSGLRQDLGIDKFEISPKDIERITGKPFTETLDLKPSDIFNLTDRAGNRVYKGIDFDDSYALSKAYLDDVSDPTNMYMNLANGVTILKKAVAPKLTKNGFKPDPYLQIKGDKISQRSNIGKLPIRARFQEAFNKGADGFHTGPAQLKEESSSPQVLLEQYNNNEKEIAKILSELGFGKKAQQGIKTTISGTDTAFDGTYVKFTDELKAAIAEQGIDAFKDGGPVEDIPSEKELAKISQTKLDEIETELKDILGFNIYENLFKDGALDKLYQSYDSSKDIKENIIDDTESKLRESLNIPYKDEIIDILQSDNPKENLEQRLDVFGTKQIDRALQGLNLPVDIKKTQEGIEFDKDIYAGDKFNVDFAGYKPDDGDFRGDIDFRYKDRGRFGNIDIQSTLDEIGDINTRARYGYSKGPFDVRAQKYPGRDATGDISYTLRDIDVGRNQKIGVKTIVDQLKRVKFNLDYMYNNPKTGGFIDAGLGLSSRGSPELNIGFGREF